MKEIWKDVPVFGGNYEASNLGRIRSKDRIVTRKHSTGGIVDFNYSGKVLSPHKDKDGYMSVHVGYKNKKYTKGVHVFVCLAFNGLPPKNKKFCLHRNGIVDENTPENLYWGDHIDNMKDRKKHGNYKKGESHVMARLTEEQAKDIILSNESTVSLSKRYSVGYYTIWDIRKGRSWAHLDRQIRY